MFTADCASCGRTVSIKLGNSAMMGGTRLSISLAAPFRATSMRGMMLLAAVVALSTKLLISCPKLALSSAIPVTRFDHADFVAFTLP